MKFLLSVKFCFKHFFLLCLNKLVINTSILLTYDYTINYKKHIAGDTAGDKTTRKQHLHWRAISTATQTTAVSEVNRPWNIIRIRGSIIKRTIFSIKLQHLINNQEIMHDTILRYLCRDKVSKQFLYFGSTSCKFNENILI